MSSLRLFEALNAPFFQNSRWVPAHSCTSLVACTLACGGMHSSTLQSSTAAILPTALPCPLHWPQVVTAHCANPADNHLLKGLFPGDDGSSMPLEALSHLQSGTFRFSSSHLARPFRCVIRSIKMAL